MFQADRRAAAKVPRQEASVAGMEGVGGENRFGAKKEREVGAVPLKDSEFDFK